MNSIEKKVSAELGEVFAWEKHIDVIKNSIAPNLTPVEFETFFYLAKRYALDPMSREIWAVKYNGPAQIFAGRDGFLKIAHASGDFDGIETYLLVELQDGNVAEMDVCPSTGRVVGAKAYVYRKSFSRPFAAAVNAKEFNQGRSLWKTMPEVMIKKVAEATALRRAFTIHGLYVPEEFSDYDTRYKKPTTVNATIVDENVPLRELSEAEQNGIIDPLRMIADRLAIATESNTDAIIQEHLGDRELLDLTKEEARELYKSIRVQEKNALDAMKDQAV